MTWKSIAVTDLLFPAICQYLARVARRKLALEVDILCSSNLTSQSGDAAYSQLQRWSLLLTLLMDGTHGSDVPQGGI